jgi:hypothetical protein
MGIISIVVTIVTFLGILWLFARKLASLFSRYIIHSDIAIIRKESERFGVTYVKLAYTGNSPLIIERVRFRTYLTIPRRSNQIKLWILLAGAYLKGDLQGIVAVNGPLRPRRPWLGRILLFVIGIPMAIQVILFLVYPIFLIGVLLLGPPQELKVLLVADDENVDIRDVDADRDCRRPFLVEPGTTNFLMKYEVRPKKQFVATTTFFRSGVSVAYVDDATANMPLKWRLPNSGQLVWEANESLQVQIRGRLWWYSVNPGKGKRRFVTISSTEAGLSLTTSSKTSHKTKMQ